MNTVTSSLSVVYILCVLVYASAAYSTCLDAKRSNPNSGAVTLTLGHHAIQVYCDQTTDGGGWTVFQRRQDGSVNFTRNWQEYKDGFGIVTAEFWLGLENLHHLTASGNYTLLVDLTHWHGVRRYAQYNKFSVGEEASQYKLYVAGYSGDAGDALTGVDWGPDSILNDQAFSTPDNDNDKNDHNCAALLWSGWWYNSCASADLNGPYGPAGDDRYGDLFWYQGLFRRSYKRTEMKFRLNR